VKLIVEREREIDAFKPEESWNIKTTLVADSKEFAAQFQKIDGKKKLFKTEADALKFLATLGQDIESFTK